MADSTEVVVFEGKTLADLMKEAHTAHKRREKKLEELIDQLTKFVNNIGDASMLSQHIQGYLDLQVKNDDVKMKMIMVLVKANQKMKEEGTAELGLSESEKAELRSLYHQANPELTIVPSKQLAK